MTSNKLTNEAKVRLKAMVDSSDGFKIAEIDLKLRGPGDILGTRQSGLLNLKIANLAHDYDILYSAREEAKKILSTTKNLDALLIFSDENGDLQTFITEGLYRNIELNPDKK